MKYKIKIILLLFLLLMNCVPKQVENNKLPLLKVSKNKRYLVDENGNPFFWLGDTGWLLFKKLNREEAETYLENRKEKGFNVIQVMLMHNFNDPVNIYGDSAFINKDITQPLTTQNNSFEDEDAYDYWDHVDYIIDLAAEKGIYMALVPVWGSNVKDNNITPEQISIYAKWLAERYKDKCNIIWLNGGDIKGSDYTDIWETLGSTLHENDPNHLITFHPRGRTQSSMWFHNSNWLDFNMIQSGHRRYDQDDTELNFGEDNWRYIQVDYNLQPIKPTIDGEPSYEDIPQGLHDTLQPYWTNNDVRRYAYWSVFAGAFGFTYGHNAIMQFYRPEDKTSSYGPRGYWDKALDAPGATQMKYLKELLLSRPFLERVPDQSLIAYDQGDKYDYLPATRGNDYAFIYAYTGRIIPVKLGILKGEKLKASWFCPRDGSWQEIGVIKNFGIREFAPPGGLMDGNDWVLVLEGI